MATTAPDRPSSEVARRLADAKEPVTPAAGPYGHPFHPILVTVPIGAWVSSLVFDVASRVTTGGNPALVEGAYWLIGIGIIGALLAAVFGLLDLLAIPRHSAAMRYGLIHLALNLSVVALFVVGFLWRNDTYDRVAETPRGPLALSVVALVLLAISGWIGGMLSYRFGVRVAREEVQAEAFR
jgi:uncharacterized membrane protein